jgi:hypothetical protein
VNHHLIDDYSLSDVIKERDKDLRDLVKRMDAKNLKLIIDIDLANFGQYLNWPAFAAQVENHNTTNSSNYIVIMISLAFLFLYFSFYFILI